MIPGKLIMHVNKSKKIDSHQKVRYMKKFGYARLYREEISPLHKIYYTLAGVSPDHKLRFKYYQNILIKPIEKIENKKILDAGCGGGDYSFYLSNIFPDSRIKAIDINHASIENNRVLQKKIGATNIQFAVQDLNELGKMEKFNVIFCIDVLEHIKEQKNILRNFYNVLDPGGYLFLHMPLKKKKSVILQKYLSDFHRWEKNEHIAQPLSAKVFLKMLKDCDFNVEVKRNSFNHYLGEFAVSLILCFYKNNFFNNFIKAMLSLLLNILINLDILIKKKSGNAIAVLARK